MIGRREHRAARGEGVREHEIAFRQFHFAAVVSRLQAVLDRHQQEDPALDGLLDVPLRALDGGGSGESTGYPDRTERTYAKRGVEVVAVVRLDGQR
jgi:hypothetical protein